VKQKRALEQIGGPIRTEGRADVLAEAWARASDEDPDTLTHGFHPWPARMHPAIARVVLAAARPRTMLDPFCGAGTSMIEARVAGVEAVGIDLSPLARRVASVKLDARDAAGRRRFEQTAATVAAASEARVRAREPIHVDLPKHELAWFGGHVIKELGGLREEIRASGPREDRHALAMVFSSILIKVSRQRSETHIERHDRRIRKGLATELFLRKARELSARWAELERVARGPMPELLEGDARRLFRLLGDRRFDVILTSPPYGGTYDYADHHARRFAWLELDDERLRRFEIGARRRSGHDDAAQRWDEDVGAMLAAMESVLSPRGDVILVIGDGRFGDRVVEAPAQLRRLAPEAGLEVVGVASQPRHGGREEHLVRLKRRD